MCKYTIIRYRWTQLHYYKIIIGISVYDYALSCFFFFAFDVACHCIHEMYLYSCTWINEWIWNKICDDSFVK